MGKISGIRLEFVCIF